MKNHLKGKRYTFLKEFVKQLSNKFSETIIEKFKTLIVEDGDLNRYSEIAM